MYFLVGQKKLRESLNLYNDLSQFSPDDLINSDKADKILLRSVENILNWALDWWINIDNYTDPLLQITDPVKRWTGNILWNEQSMWE